MRSVVRGERALGDDNKALPPRSELKILALVLPYLLGIIIINQSILNCWGSYQDESSTAIAYLLVPSDRRAALSTTTRYPYSRASPKEDCQEWSAL